MSTLGHREHPHKKLPLLADLRLIGVQMRVEDMARTRDNEGLRAYLYELLAGTHEDCQTFKKYARIK